MLTAYNERTDNKIEFTIPDIPFNLFGLEAESFKSIIAFDKNNAWAIDLQIVRPYKTEEIPNIILKFVRSESSGKNAKEMAQANWGGVRSFLLLIADPKEERIKPNTSDLNMYVGNIKDYYSIKPSDYKSAMRELFTTLIEYQLVSLVHQNSGKGSV